MYPVRRVTSPHAARLRRDATDAERMLWAALRNRQLGGFKVRRQATIGRFVVDFLRVEAMLVVEVDGGQHRPAVDAGRTAALEAAGHQVVRFWNNEVVENRGGVLEGILGVLIDRTAKKALTQPSPANAGQG